MKVELNKDFNLNKVLEEQVGGRALNEGRFDRFTQFGANFTKELHDLVQDIPKPHFDKLTNMIFQI